MSKIDLLRAWASHNKPDIITVSETWLHSGISNNDVEMDGYLLYRVDRGSRGGGVVTYVCSNLCSQHSTPKIGPIDFECVFVNIILHVNKLLTIGNIYRPPSAPSGSMKNILSTLSSLEKNNECIILGDFNSNWLDRSSVGDRDLISSVNLSQLINKPTRVNLQSSTLIDWILVTNPERILSSGVMSDCLSDHSVIYCVWKIKMYKAHPKDITFRQCKYFDVNLFNDDMGNINWQRLSLIPTVNDAWDFFYSEVMKVINKHAHLKQSE